MQLANAVATIGNGGSRYQLSLLKATEQNGEWVETKPRLAPRQVDFGDGESLKIVQKAMQRVTLRSWNGTAQTAFDGAAYPSAGKTGTVQLKKEEEDEDGNIKKSAKKFHDNAVYVGYAPHDNPSIAISVVTENGGHGGESAAPVARKVMDAYFARTNR